MLLALKKVMMCFFFACMCVLGGCAAEEASGGFFEDGDTGPATEFDVGPSDDSDVPFQEGNVFENSDDSQRDRSCSGGDPHIVWFSAEVIRVDESSMDVSVIGADSADAEKVHVQLASGVDAQMLSQVHEGERVRVSYVSGNQPIPSSVVSYGIEAE